MTVPLERQKSIADVAARVRDQLGLDTAALKPAEAFATAAQGEKADNAQPRLDSLFLVGASRYPQSINQRLTQDSLAAADVVASKFAFSGAAAIDGVTWVNGIMPGTDGVGVVTNYTISPNGKYGSVSAVRASDNAALTRQNIIAHTDVARIDNADVAHFVWGRYTHAWWDGNAHPGSFLLGEENSLHNDGADAVRVTPWGLRGGSSNAGQRVNLRLTAGTGGVPSNRVTSAIQITANNAKYASGIIIASDALDVTGGYADGLAMSVNHGISWNSAGSDNAMWRISMNVSSIAAPGSIVLGNGVMQVFNADYDVQTAGRGYKVAGVKVVGAKIAGWAADSGSALRSGKATYSDTAAASYSQTQMQALMDAVMTATQTIKALKDDLITHGLIGS